MGEVSSGSRHMEGGGCWLDDDEDHLNRGVFGLVL